MLIEKVMGAGKTSYYGNNVATFTVFRNVMLPVVYDLYFWVKLPPLRAEVWFDATQFYSFYQSIDTDWNLWSEALPRNHPGTIQRVPIGRNSD